MLTHGSLFSGVGGFDRAADLVGMQTLWQVEIDPIARSVLARHWPDVTRYEDVTAVSGRDLAPVHVITAGFPCVDLSVAGKRAGLSAPRSGLFWQITRIVSEMREATDGRLPAILLLENVPGWLSSHGGRDFGVALDGLAECGALAIGWRVLDARWFGVAQRRRRVFVVADFTDRWRAEEVLALADSLSGHPAPRRQARETTPASTGSGAGSGGEPAIAARQVARSLRARHNHTHREDSDTIIGYQATGDAFWRAGIGPLAASDDNGSNHVVATSVSRRGRADGTAELGGDVAYALSAAQGSMTAATVLTDVASAITASASPRGDGSDNLVVIAEPLAFTSKDSGGDVVPTSPTLRAMNYDQSHLNGGGQVAIFEARYARNGRGAPEAGRPPLKAQSGQTGKGDGAPLVFQQNQRDEVRLMGGDGQAAGALPAQPGMKQQNYVAASATVRRLMPVECERLMSLPDGWTDGHADSHRYRLLGNSVVVNVVEWLARRIVAAWDGER